MRIEGPASSVDIKFSSKKRKSGQSRENQNDKLLRFYNIIGHSAGALQDLVQVEEDKPNNRSHIHNEKAV